MIPDVQFDLQQQLNWSSVLRSTLCRDYRRLLTSAASEILLASPFLYDIRSAVTASPSYCLTISAIECAKKYYVVKLFKMTI